MTVSMFEAGLKSILSTGINEISYRLSIRYESDYGQHSDNLYVQENNFHAVIEKLPAAIRNDIRTDLKILSGDENTKTYDYIKGKLFNNDDQVETFVIALEDFIRHPGHNINIEPLDF